MAGAASGFPLPRGLHRVPHEQSVDGFPQQLLLRLAESLRELHEQLRDLIVQVQSDLGAQRSSHAADISSAGRETPMSVAKKFSLSVAAVLASVVLASPSFAAPQACLSVTGAKQDAYPNPSQPNLLDVLVAIVVAIL